MPSIHPGPLPEDALLQRYRQDGSYTDCYYMDLPVAISMSDYIAAFYTTPLFKLERLIIAVFARRPSTDVGARELGLGRASHFAAWNTEARASNQLLMSDYLGNTRSWFMLTPVQHAGASLTRLYFGSAVIPKSRSASGKPSFGFVFQALFGFHRLYTKALMRAAQSKLLANLS